MSICPECGWGHPTVAWSEACPICRDNEWAAYVERQIDQDREAT